MILVYGLPSRGYTEDYKGWLDEKFIFSFSLPSQNHKYNLAAILNLVQNLQ